MVTCDTSETRLKLFLAQTKRERELQQKNKLATCFTTKPENLSPSIPSVSTTLSPPSNSCPQSAPRAVSENQGGFSADLIWEKETGPNKAKWE